MLQFQIIGPSVFLQAMTSVVCALIWVCNWWLFCFLEVGSWLKNLRLHKYGSLFSQLSYEEMLGLNEEYLESKVCKQ